MDKNIDLKTVLLDVVVRIHHNESPEGIVEDLAQVEGIHRVKVSE